MNQATQSNLDNILDMTLDDLADMPSISLYPNGAHKVTVEFKTDDKKASVQMSLTYVEALELADPTATPPEAGTKNTVFFNLKKKDGAANEYAQGALKNILVALKGLGGSTSHEIMEAAKGAEIAVVTKIRVGKGEYEGRDSLDVLKAELI